MGKLVRLVVEARRLDTDECSRRTFEIKASPKPFELQAEMERLVAHVHPAARMREFTEDGATFVDHRSTIAAYVLGPSDATGVAPPAGQDRLFAS